MRAVVEINDELLEKAKLKAAQEQKTLDSVFEESLRLALERDRQLTEEIIATLPAYGSGGLLPGVDLDNTSSLLDRMDGWS